VKNAGTAVVKISATVTDTADRKGVPVSIRITGTFAADHKIVCPGGASAKASTASSLTGTRTDAPKPPIAAFERDPEGGSILAQTNTINFSDTSTDPDGGNIETWQWEFGDGATDFTQNPTHTYTQTGTFIVTLTVRDSDDGASSSTTRTVQIDN
jgi:PKD repeat protein